tara:strand:+ start:124 stop:417 length:294 start_codon:yes stop_codon:yes gene_type:complete
MTQYDEKVELQKQILKAEEYKDTPKNLHAHSLDSMWYETEETKPQTKEGVVDVQYMDGRIERTLKNGKKITLVEGMKGEDLVQEVTRNLADSGKHLE